MTSIQTLSSVNALPGLQTNYTAANNPGSTPSFDNLLQTEISAQQNPKEPASTTLPGAETKQVSATTKLDPEQNQATATLPDASQPDLLTLIIDAHTPILTLDIPKGTELAQRPNTEPAQRPATAQQTPATALPATVQPMVTAAPSAGNIEQKPNTEPAQRPATAQQSPATALPATVQPVMTGTSSTGNIEQKPNTEPAQRPATAQQTPATALPATVQPVMTGTSLTGNIEQKPNTEPAQRPATALPVVTGASLAGNIEQKPNTEPAQRPATAQQTPATALPQQPVITSTQASSSIQQPQMTEAMATTTKAETSVDTPILAMIEPASPAKTELYPTTIATTDTYSIRPSISSPNWDQAISQRVLWMTQNKLQSASLTLNPPDLGPVQVLVQLNNQQATVQFVSAQAEVREALQNALPMLGDLFKQAGIQLEHSDVSSRNQNSDPRQPPRSNAVFADGESNETAITEVSLRTSGTQGLINIAV